MIEKSRMIELFQSADSYQELLAYVHEEEKYAKWSRGFVDAVSLEPYFSEIIGIKRGKLLKGVSKPDSNRIQYVYDIQDRLIYVIKYIQPLKNGQGFLHDDHIIKYEGNCAVQYGFTSISEKNPKLKAVSCFEFEGARVLSKTTLGNNYETFPERFTSTKYTYQGDVLTGITVSWPDGPYPDRVLEVYPESEKDVSIYEVTAKKGKVLVYPK